MFIYICSIFALYTNNLEIMYTTTQQFDVNKENNTFIKQGCIIWIQNDSKDMYDNRIL